MLRIRLTRTGRKKRPSYRVVVAEAGWARDGRRVAELGYYDPLTDPSTIRLDVAAAEGPRPPPHLGQAPPVDVV